jgi:hypothetical protein
MQDLSGHDPLLRSQREAPSFGAVWLKNGEKMSMIQRIGCLIVSLPTLGCGLWVAFAAIGFMRRVDVVFSRWYLHRRGHPGRSILSRCRDTWPEKRSAIVVSCSPNRSARVLRGMESAALLDLFALKIEENRADQAVPLFTPLFTPISRPV